MEEEVWVPVGFAVGSYEVSSFGRVRSLDFYLKSGKVRRGRVLKLSINRRGYFIVKIFGKTFKPHRLVCTAFHPNPEDKPQVNHIDLNPLNNHKDNLEWATAKENTNHAQLNGRIPIATPKIKKGYPEGHKEIVDISNGLRYRNVKHLSKECGISIKNLRRMISGERVNHTYYRYVGQENVVKMPQRVRCQDSLSISFQLKRILKKGRVKRTPLKKQMIKYDMNGVEVGRYPSVSDAAKSVNSNPKTFGKGLKESSRNFYKGFIFKYA